MLHIKTKELVISYVLGTIFTAICIGLIHLYSYFFEPFFRYAEKTNIVETCLIGGVCFGISIWAFKKYLQLKNSLGFATY